MPSCIRRTHIMSCLAVGAFLIALLASGVAVAQAPQAPLDPTNLQKYIDDLVIPPAMPEDPGVPRRYSVGIYGIRQVLSNQPPFNTVGGGAGTYVFAYGSDTNPGTAHYPAFTFETRRGRPIRVKWINRLNGVVHPLPVDTTIMWANPLNQLPGTPYTGPVPVVTHLHGGEVPSTSDGHPMDWFLPGKVNWDWYPNAQPPTTLWYHDHALGFTRLNPYMGLAGFYLLRDPANEPAGLPGPAPQRGDAPGAKYYEIPLAIQDRIFDTTGELFYPIVAPNPAVHPLWMPEFFGNTMLVNGVVWPKLNVEPRRYRFRFLNGCNARFLGMRLFNETTGQPGPAFWQIGTDGGYLNAPVMLNNPNQVVPRRLVMGPGERADVIIDFTGIAPGTNFILNNNAQFPFPMGFNPEPNMDAQIMRFDVVAPAPGTPPDTSLRPGQLVLRGPANQIPPLVAPGPHPHNIATRKMVLYEKLSTSGVLEVYLDGKSFGHPLTETPTEGTTEVWELINLTMDTHPIHTHLTQFQLLARQQFNFAKYLPDYDAVNPVIPTPVTTTPDVWSYLLGTPKAPLANERGWKDTVQMHPLQVTWIAIRYGQLETGAAYTFDPSVGPGYVWHCHILEHEENEMMRPFTVTR